MRWTTRGLAASLAAVGILAASTRPASAQGAGEVPPIPLPGDHWAVGWLDALWLTGEQAPTRSAEPRLGVDRAAGVVCAAASAACERLLRSAGLGTRDGAVSPLAGADVRDGGRHGVTAGAVLRGGRWGVDARPRFDFGRGELAGGTAAAGVRLGGDVVIAAGHDAFAFGPGVAGLIRGDEVAKSYLAVALEPARAPGFLAGLGEWSGATTLGRLSDDRLGSPEAWWWATRVVLAPARGLQLGLNRAFVFGGEGDGVLPTSASRVFRMILGRHNTEDRIDRSLDYDDQILSVDVRYRPAALPAELYAEWGAEDSAGAAFDSPGLRLGARLGFRGTVLGYGGLEFASLAAADQTGSRNPPWYGHGALGPYRDEGGSLGHPLGGHGTEWRLYGFASSPDAAWRGTLELFTRERRADNPLGAGTSRGAGARLEHELRPGLTVHAAAAGAWSDGDGPADAGDLRIGVLWVRGR